MRFTVLRNRTNYVSNKTLFLLGQSVLFFCVFINSCQLSTNSNLGLISKNDLESLFIENDWQVTKFKAKKENKKVNLKGHRVFFFNDGSFEMYKVIPKEITAESTMENGSRIFYDQKIKSTAKRDVIHGDYKIKSADNVQLNIKRRKKNEQAKLKSINRKIDFEIMVHKLKKRVIFKSDLISFEMEIVSE